MKRKQAGAIHLAVVALLFMLLALAALSFLYSVRYGHWPLQEWRASWGKSATALSAELPVGVQPATVESGIFRCTIRGKLVYSDHACDEHNPTTRAVKLQDNKGFEPPKAAAAAPESQGAAAADAREKLIDQLAK